MSQNTDNLLVNTHKENIFGNFSAEFDNALKRDAKLVASRKRSPPKYYDSLASTEQIIGGATEDALIVTAAQAKQKAVAYLKDMAAVKSVTNDYNELLTEYADARAADSSAVISDLDQLTGKFNDFRKELTKQPTIEIDVKTGFSPVLSAMVRSLGRLGLKDRRERFHNLFDSISREQYFGDQTEDLKSELRSWIRVFVTYP